MSKTKKDVIFKMAREYRTEDILHLKELRKLIIRDLESCVSKEWIHSCLREYSYSSALFRAWFPKKKKEEVI